MNSEIKRRTFLSGVIAALAAGPFAIRHFRRDKAISSNKFCEEFQKYQALVDLPIQTVDGPSIFNLNLSPPIGSRMNYVVFLPSVISGQLSRATADEPDGFYVREGRFAVQRTDREQTVFYGGDDVAKVCYPTSAHAREHSEITLLAQDGQLYQAGEVGKTSNSLRDSQMFHLLTLKQLPEKALTVGMKWASNIGRVRPFEGIKTNHEVLGFSEIAGRKTVNIKFDGLIANAAHLPGMREGKIESNETMKNTHSGNAWFDLETGLLTRQETEMVTEIQGVPWLDKPLTVTSRSIVQLFVA